MKFPRIGLCKVHYNRKRDGADMDAPIRHRGQRATPAKASKSAKPDDKEDRPAAVVDEVEKTTDKPVGLANKMTPAQVAMFQRGTCRRHTRCSLLAKRRGWAGWSCSDCSGPGTPKVGG